MKRPTVAFFVSEIEGGYSSLVCRSVVETAQKLDVHLILFPGKSLRSPGQYHIQYNTIYQLLLDNKVDALILASGILVNYISLDEYKEFYKQFSNIPIVSLSTPLEGASTVYVDNRVGLEEMIQHVVRVHERKKVAYLSGPLSHPEAVDRLSIFRDSMHQLGVTYSESSIVYGDFTDMSVGSNLSTLLDERKIVFDALICANDEMALRAIDILKSRNFRIPQDIVVTGFDNVEESMTAIPSLSTVKQPLYEQAVRAVEIAVELIRGAQHRVEGLPSEAIFRHSCGCVSYSRSHHSASSAQAAPKATGEQAEIIQEIRDVWTDSVTSLATPDLLERFRTEWEEHPLRDSDIHFWQETLTALRREIRSRRSNGTIDSRVEDFFEELRTLLVEALIRQDARRWKVHHVDIRTLRMILNLMVLNVQSVHDALESIVPELVAVGLNSGYVYLYEKEIKYDGKRKWVNPSSMQVAIAYRDGVILDEKRLQMPVASNSIFQIPLQSPVRRTVVVNPLFFSQEHFGLFLCEMNFEDRFIFESLCVQLSCSLKLMKLVSQHRVMEKQLYNALTGLEESNRKLDSLSQTDELTGLYNRRGFLNLARQNMDLVKKMKKQGNLFFGDLDGLKKINDTWGHEEGDRAIIAMSDILRHVFRNMDIVARLGGDEFTIFTADTDRSFIDILNQRIKEHMDEFNGKKEHPFVLSMSLGAVPFDHSTEKSIEELMAEADAQLYRIKRLRAKQAPEEA